MSAQPSFDELREAYPEDWEAVRTELAAVVATGDRATLEAYVGRLASGEAAVSGPAARADVRRALAVGALRRHLVAAASGVEQGRVRFGLVNGWVAQRLLFEHGLVRKPVRLGWFRLLWPLLWQRRRLMPLVEPQGIYCFYSRPLIERLAALIDGRSCLEIAAGDGTLTRFLRDRGVDVAATDDGSWSGRIAYPDFVRREDAADALRRHAPAVVLCSWPPAGNGFERHVFRTRSVQTYVVMASRNPQVAGSPSAYAEQTAFERRDDAELARLVLPPELESAVHVFERRA